MFASSDRLVEIYLVIVQNSSLQTFWYQEPVSWKTIFPWTGEGRDGLEMIQVHYIYCVLYFYSYFISSASGHLRHQILKVGDPWSKDQDQTLHWSKAACLGHTLRTHGLPCGRHSWCITWWWLLVDMYRHMGHGAAGGRWITWRFTRKIQAPTHPLKRQYLSAHDSPRRGSFIQFTTWTISECSIQWH